jgi:glutamate dehydrogenase/leucine dehydrogenase
MFLVTIAAVVHKEGEKDRVQSRLMMTITDTYRRVAGMAKENNISLRRAAYSIAMEQVVEAMKARG